MGQYLELNFNGSSLTTKGGADGAQWIGGSEYYEVKVNITDGKKYDYFHLILADGSNKQVIEVETAYLKDYSYWGKFYVPRIMGNDTLVNIGVIAKEINTKNTITSSPLLITVKSGIAQPTAFTLEGVDEINNSGFTSLLNLLEGGIVVKSLDVVNKSYEGKRRIFLRIEYKTKDESYTTDLGPIDFNLVHMGAEIARDTNTNKGGGGKIGIKSQLDDNKDGFAGGYNSRACSGVAIGPDTYTHTGVAIGYKAQAKPTSAGSQVGRDGIAIGQHALVDGKSESSIALGDHSRAVNSDRSIVIGSITTDTENKGGTVISNSEKAIAIGHNCKVSNIEGGIAIGPAAILKQGTHANSTGKKDKFKANSIAIGKDARSTFSGSIAIGPGANSGFVDNDDNTPLIGNYEDSHASGARPCGAIAIGRKAYGRRTGCVAVGRNARSVRGRSIAIGDKAAAGNMDYSSNSYADSIKDEEGYNNCGIDSIAIGTSSDALGTNSIAIGHNSAAYGRACVAIGTGAKATSSNVKSKDGGAIQLGKGTNKTNKSLQFRNKQIAREKNGKARLVIDLDTDIISGTLPIENGGTEANNTYSAQRKLGIYTGQKTFKLSNADPYKEIEIKYTNESGKAFEPFKETPIVNVTLGTKDKGAVKSVYAYSWAIISSSTKGFTVKVGAEKKGKTQEYYLNWIAIGRRDKKA